MTIEAKPSSSHNFIKKNKEKEKFNLFSKVVKYSIAIGIISFMLVLCILFPSTSMSYHFSSYLLCLLNDLKYKRKTPSTWIEMTEQAWPFGTENQENF